MAGTQGASCCRPAFLVRFLLCSVRERSSDTVISYIISESQFHFPVRNWLTWVRSCPGGPPVVLSTRATGEVAGPVVISDDLFLGGEGSHGTHWRVSRQPPNSDLLQFGPSHYSVSCWLYLHSKKHLGSQKNYCTQALHPE